MEIVQEKHVLSSMRSSPLFADHGRQQKNRKWLLRVQGSLGIITFNEAIYIQAMKMLRPVSSIENGVPVSRIKKSLKRKAVPETKEANIKKEHQDEVSET